MPRFQTKMYDETGNLHPVVIAYTLQPFAVETVTCGVHITEPELARVTAECRKYAKQQLED